ncbi:MAG: GNAT family N-acetyltransferase [Pseudomonadota bacterium]
MTHAAHTGAVAQAGAVQIDEIPPDHPDALALIAGSEAELAALYPPEHRLAFSPQELAAAKVRFCIARTRPASGATLLGCGGVAPLSGYAELKRVYVTPQARGRGVAEALLRRLEAIARQLDLPVMRLETGHLSPAAIALYTRQGYVRIGPFGAYVENGSSLFMEKRLG